MQCNISLIIIYLAARFYNSKKKKKNKRGLSILLHLSKKEKRFR